MADEERYQRLLDKVQSARAEFETKQDDVQQARQSYFDAVRALNDAGMPLREVAQTLGLSHQRVHQMVAEAHEAGAKGSRRARRAARAGGVGVLLVALAAGVGVWINGGPGIPETAVSPTRVASTDPIPPRSEPAKDRGPLSQGVIIDDSCNQWLDACIKAELRRHHMMVTLRRLAADMDRMLDEAAPRRR